MDGSDPISGLGLECPVNGTFYICKNSPTRFIGCCTLNPCGDRKGLCPDEHLEPATYEARYKIPPQACINDNIAVSWYTCPDTSPPFLGCCAVDPCSKRGCPDRELRAAKLSDKKSNADLYAGGSAPGSSTKGIPLATLSVSTATFSTSYISTRIIDAGVGATSTLDAASPVGQPQGGEKGLSTAEIVGIAFGVITCLLLALIIALCYMHRKRRQAHSAANSQPPSRRTTASSPTSSSQKRPMSIFESISWAFVNLGHIIRIEVSPATPPRQQIHQSSLEERQSHPECGEQYTQQPQPSHDTRPPIPIISVQAPKKDQMSMSNPPMPNPPYPLSSDHMYRWNWENHTQRDDRSYKPYTPSAELPANTETALSTNPPSTPVGRPQSPIAELPANTETPLSTGRPSTPVFRMTVDEVDCRWHEPSPRQPESSPQPPITRPSTAPPSSISEEQSADDIDSSNTVAMRLGRQLSHDQ